MSANTLFLRLEGALQAWGTHESKFVVRRSADAPTKSGVIGLLLAALGVARDEAVTVPPRFADEPWLAPHDSLLAALCRLEFGVRIDRPGIRWWDYHTVGGGEGVSMRRADGGTRNHALLTRREYLCDASFLVALRGEPELVAELYAALHKPKWTLYLGRKSCPPGYPLLETAPQETVSIQQAICQVPWRPRYKDLPTHKHLWPDEPLDCYCDWVATDAQPEAPTDAEVWYDVPVSLDPPSHNPRFVLQRTLFVGPGKDVERDGESIHSRTLTPPRPRAGYQRTEYRKARCNRLVADEHLCVLCKQPATTVQHVTYRNAERGEQPDDLRALCRICHDAITMLEYGAGMGLDRINPEDEAWRERIIEKRGEIIEFRSRQRRKERMSAREEK